MNTAVFTLIALNLLHTLTSAFPAPATNTTATAKPVKVSDQPKELAATVLEGRASRMEITDSQLDMALKDKRYMQRQLKCILGEVPCDPVGRRLKTVAPLVLRGVCPQCTPTETRQIQKVILHMQKNFPREWSRLLRSYTI